jgi:hypothetical protein
MHDETVIMEIEAEPVRVIVDEPTDGSGPAAGGTVLMLSPYGMNAESMFAPAFVLASNGLRVLRLDGRNSPNGTATALRGFRLSRLARDIREALDRFRPDGLFAMSLAAPAALRALSEHAVPATALVIPVVHFRATLRAVLGEDWFDRVGWDHDTAYYSVLGHDVDTDMVRDCQRNRFETLDDTRRDLAAAGGRVAMFASDVDPWVDIYEVRAVAEATGAELTEIPLAGHVLYRNPVLAMRFFAEAATWLIGLIHADGRAVTVPPFAQVVSALEETRRLSPQGAR